MSYTDPTTPPPLQPVPVQALPYSIPTTSARPGIITALGVMSIVVACMSGIGSFGTGMYGFGFYMMSKMTAAMSAPSSGTVATSYSFSTSSASVSSAVPNPARLSVGDAGVAVNALRKTLNLDASHVRELDRLMRNHGRQVLGGADDERLTSATVAADVISSTPQCGTSPASFTTAEGTTTVWADRASFAATDGSLRIDTSAHHHTDQTSGNSSSSGASASASGVGTTLTTAQVNNVVNSAASNSTNTLNPAQLNAVRAQVSVPNQTLVSSGGGTSVIAVYNQPGGNATITFDSGNMLVVSPTGTVVSSGPPPIPNFKIGLAVVIVLVAEAIASVALAIYLLVVGIQVLRGSFSSRRLLKIYAWIKIPLAITAGVALPMMFYQFVTGIAASTPTGPGTAGAPLATGFVVWGAIMTIVSLAFPVGVLIALRSRTVRNYYNAVIAGA